MRPRWLVLVGWIVLAVVIAGMLLSWQPAIAPIAPPSRSGFSQQEIARGGALAAVGDCMACHTADGGRPFAGGLPIRTPFGTVFSTNITPEPRTGIGSWSLAAFTRALRAGIARDGTHLYPAFPYYHFAQMSEADIAALYAYLMTREPVRAQARSNRLLPPFDIRTLLAGWNFLFLHRNPFQPDTTRNAAWNRGAYLAQTLGHCGACHTPHNALGAEETDRRYAGGVAEGWYAPPLDAHSPAPVPWTAEEIATYLRTGAAKRHGGAAGPMRRVTGALRTASPGDVYAMATYVASLMPRKLPPREREPAGAPPEAAVFAGACAACHEAPRWAPLANSTTLAEASPRDTLEILLHGIPRRGDGLYMPSFAAMLDDAQTATLANYLRAHFARQAPWNDARPEAGRIRNETSDR